MSSNHLGQRQTPANQPLIAQFSDPCRFRRQQMPEQTLHRSMTGRFGPCAKTSHLTQRLHQHFRRIAHKPVRPQPRQTASTPAREQRPETIAKQRIQSRAAQRIPANRLAQLRSQRRQPMLAPHCSRVAAKRRMRQSYRLTPAFWRPAPRPMRLWRTRRLALRSSSTRRCPLPRFMRS